MSMKMYFHGSIGSDSESFRYHLVRLGARPRSGEGSKIALHAATYSSQRFGSNHGSPAQQVRRSASALHFSSLLFSNGGSLPSVGVATGHGCEGGSRFSYHATTKLTARQLGYVIPRSAGVLEDAVEIRTVEGARGTTPLAQPSPSLPGSDEKNRDLESSPSYSAEITRTTTREIGAGNGISRTGQSVEEGISYLPAAVQRNLARRAEWSRPFRWAIDVPRGLLQCLQTLLHYLLM